MTALSKDCPREKKLNNIIGIFSILKLTSFIPLDSEPSLKVNTLTVGVTKLRVASP